MENKNKMLLPRVEIMVIGVLFLIFLIWSVSKCSSTRRRLAQEAEQQAIEQAEYEASLLQKQQAATTARDSMPPQPAPSSPGAFRQTYTPLYITLDVMNVRSAPSINSSIIERLKLFDEVEFLNEVTDFREEITIGEEITREPWVKVKTPKGKVGWVYGAGVSYYKTKRIIPDEN